MPIIECQEKRIEAIKTIKRHCLFCNARHSLNPELEKEKKIVLNKLSELKETYAELFNKFRGKNECAEKIQRALKNKRACMDAIDLCRDCDRKVDKVNRFLSGK